MNDSPVTTSEKDAVLFVTLNRPERRNPLSSDMIAALCAAIESGNEDPSTRVIVIRAVGPAFSAGHDLRETRRRDDEDDTAWQTRIDALLQDCAHDARHQGRAILQESIDSRPPVVSIFTVTSPCFPQVMSRAKRGAGSLDHNDPRVGVFVT